MPPQIAREPTSPRAMLSNRMPEFWLQKLFWMLVLSRFRLLRSKSSLPENA